MDHGRLRELEWQRDDLWRRMCLHDTTGGNWHYLMRAYEAACAELQRGL